MKVQRRYSPVAVAKALGVDLMAENYTLVAGMDFTRELGSKLADSSDAVLAKTRQLIKDELQGLSQSVGEIVRNEINKALQNTVVKRKPEPRPQETPDPQLRAASDANRLLISFCASATACRLLCPSPPRRQAWYCLSLANAAFDAGSILARNPITQLSIVERSIGSLQKSLSRIFSATRIQGSTILGRAGFGV